MLAAIIQFQDEHSTSSFPRLVGLPNIAALIGRRVVAQTTAARIDRFVSRAARFARVARDGSRNRIARREDVQALIAVHRELHRNGLTGVDNVDRRKIVNRLEEAGKAIQHRHGEAAVGSITRRIGRHHVNRRHAEREDRA